MAPTPGEHRVFVRAEERGRAVPGAAFIQAYFEQFGEVLDVYRPPSTPDIAYVTLSSAEEVQAALCEPRALLGDLACGVLQAAPRGSSSSPGHAQAPQQALQAPRQQAPFAAAFPATAVSASHRAYVAGLPEYVDEAQLTLHFGQFGAVKDIYIPADRATGQKKPFCFVTMSAPEELQLVLSTPQHHLGDGVLVSVTLAEPREQAGRPQAGGLAGGAPLLAQQLQPGLQALQARAKAQEDEAALALTGWQAFGGGPVQGIPGNFRLFVFGMPEGLNADMLRGHFARHGEILDIYVPPRSQDIAYVTFAAEEELQDALVNSGLRIAGFWVKGMKQAERRDKGGGGRAPGPPPQFGLGKGREPLRMRPY